MFLANENFPRPSTLILRDKGFQVISIQEQFQGISDEEVIQIALDKGLIILTFDRDYGELIFKYAKDNPPAVVYFREKGNSPEFGANCLINLKETNIELANAFTVVEQNNIRQRFYKR